MEDETNDPIDTRALARAVILRALEDAKGAEDTCDRGTARAFLTSPTGVWATSRNVWCDRAGVDPDAFFERVSKVLA